MKIFKKVLAMALSLAMVLGMSVSAFADETAPTYKITDATSFAQALSTGGTWTVVDDDTDGVLNISAAEQLLLTAGNLTIDLSGIELKITNTDDYAIRMNQNNTSLTLKNGIFTSIGKYAIRHGSNGTVDTALTVASDATVNGTIVSRGKHVTTIAGTVKVTNGEFAIASNGTKNADGTFESCGTFNITGTVSSDDVAVYLAGNDQTTISGATITGKTAVEVRGGTVGIENSTLTATGSYSVPTSNVNGSTSSGIALAVAQHTPGIAVNVDVASGTFTATDNDGQSVIVASPESPSAPGVVTVKLDGGNYENGVAHIAGEENEVVSVSVTGGSYSNDVTAFIPESNNLPKVYVTELDEADSTKPAAMMVGAAADAEITKNGGYNVNMGEGSLQVYFPTETMANDYRDAVIDSLVDDDQTKDELEAVIPAPKYEAPTVTTPSTPTVTEPSWNWDVEVEEEEEEIEVLKGSKQKYTQGADEGLSFRFDAKVKNFRRLKIDGKTVDKANYAVTEGSTIITLNPEYMDTLKAGKHTLKAIFKDGSAEVKFTVLEGAKVVAPSAPAADADKLNPSTGSNDFVGAAVAMAVVSVAGVALLSKKH